MLKPSSESCVKIDILNVMREITVVYFAKTGNSPFTVQKLKKRIYKISVKNLTNI